MSRSVSQDNSTDVSLFPFLAVLLCTMGGLIILLVMTAHAARQKAVLVAEAEQAKATQVTADDSALAEKLEEARRRQAEIEAIKEKAAQTLRDEQLRLGQIESHVRRLQDQLRSLRDAVLELQAMNSDHLDDQEQAKRELARLQQLIVDTEKEIADLETEQEGKFRSYAIVPYRGPNGTQRRPVYIECRAETVVLQPEGIELTAEDFKQPLGVSNPLLAAIRATRKYHQQATANGRLDIDAEPYPLVIVRPEGIGAYYQTRAALSSGDTEFGYEMVNGDWDLEFPQPNPELANLQARAIESARARRDLLAKAAPTAYESDGPASFTIDPRRHGGENQGTPNGILAGLGGGAGGRGSANGSAGEGNGPANLSGSPYSMDDTLLGESGGNEGGSNRGATSSGVATDSTNEPNSTPLAALGGEINSESHQADPTLGAPNSMNQGGGGEASSVSDRYADSDQPFSGAGGYAADGSPEAGESQSNAAGGNTAGGEGEVAAASGSGSSDSMGSPGEASNGASVTANANAGAQQSGSPGNSQSREPGPDDIAIRRSLQMIVRSDQVAVLPHKAVQSQQPVKDDMVVAFNGPTQQHLGQLANVIRAEVGSWGIAGRGFYWKPVLLLTVAPDGLQRADELKRMLDRSGIEVRYYNTAQAPYRQPFQGGPNATR